MLARYGARWGVTEAADIAATPLYFIFSSLILLAATPLTNTLIRRHEAQADSFGLEVAREPDGFAETAMISGEYRKLLPTPIEEALIYNHPAPATRIRHAMAWKAAHLAELPADQRGILRPPSASSMPPSASTTPAAASGVQR